MDCGPIQHPNIGESSQLSVPSSQKLDPVGDIGIQALSEQQKTLLEKINTTPPNERRLSQVLPSLKEGSNPVARSWVIIKVPDNHRTNCNKEIGIEIFAPTRSKSTNKVLLEMVQDNFERIKGMRLADKKAEIKKAGGDTSTLDPETIPLPELNEEQKQKLKTLKTHSSDHLDLVEALPIVIFSHGLRMDPSVYRPLVEEIASQGFIVLNVNHPATSSRADFSNEAMDLKIWDQLVSSAAKKNEKIEKNEEKLNQIKEMDVLEEVKLEIEKNKEKLNQIYNEMDVLEEGMVEKETNNIRFIIDQIRNGNLEGLPKEFGKEKPIILAGHSLGGAVSMIVARDNPNIAGCINLDGRLAGKSTEEKTADLKVPTLLFFIEGDHNDQEIGKFLQNNPNSTHKSIEGVEHNDFTIYPIVDWVAGGNRLDQGLKAHKEASEAMVNFMKNLDKK